MDSSNKPPHAQEAHSQISSANNDLSKPKTIHIILGIAVLAIIAIGTYILVARKNQSSNKSDIDNLSDRIISQSPQSTVSPKPTLPDIKVDSQLSLPTNDINTTIVLQETNLIFALKQGNLVQVFRKNTTDGSQFKLFEYDESAKANKQSGNFSESLPPSIALSPNKQYIAYTDINGLKLYDLLTEKQQTLIYKTTNPAKNSGESPKWSEKQIIDTYNLGLPSWSSDSRYISFAQSHYEGSSYGIFDISNNVYRGGLPQLAVSPLKWSPVSNFFVRPQTSGGYRNPGLFVGDIGNISGIKNLGEIFNKTNSSFSEASFSPNGSKVVFAYEAEATSDLRPTTYIATNILAIADINGANFRILAEGDSQDLMPLFSPDGNSIFFIEQGQNQAVLSRYDLQTNVVTRIAGLSKDFRDWQSIGWTKDGYLSLIGANKFILIDINDKSIIYSLNLLSRFVTLAGFTN